MSEDAPRGPEFEARLAALRALQRDFSGIDPATALDGDPDAQALVDSLMTFVTDDSLGP